MGCTLHELVTEQQLQPQSTWCEFEYIVCKMKRIMLGMAISSDLHVYQVLAKHETQAQLTDMVKLTRTFPERPMAAGQAVCDVQSTSCCPRRTWEHIGLGGALQDLKTGTKRGLRETETFPQHFHDYCGSTITEGPSKRCKHVGHLVLLAGRKRQGETGDGSSNPNRKDVIGEECNKSICKTSFSTCYKDNAQDIRKYIEKVIPTSSPDTVPGREVRVRSAFAFLCGLRDLPMIRWLVTKKRTVSVQRKRVEVPREKPPAAGTDWDSLPNHLQENILQRVKFKDLFRFKTLAKSCKEYIESDVFTQWRGADSSREGFFTAINYYIEDKAWRCTGFDLHSMSWRALPPFSPALPAPDAELFKEYSVCGHGGLMCADVAKLPQKGKLVVFNPLTRKTFALPPLLNPRSPVLVHISVDPKTKSYKVMVAGSSTASDEHLSKKMEVFDSKTSKWEEAADLPGPAFGLNEHQAGVCLHGVLYLISFLDDKCRRGVVAFDVENRTWLDNMLCPIPFSTYSNTLQLVASDGKLYLFSEQERGGSVEHCIDALEISTLKVGAEENCQLRNVVRVKKSGGRGLQVYPENTCVAFGEGKLCVFNTLNRGGVVYEMQNGTQSEVLQPPPPHPKWDNFFSLNPASFTLQPSFDRDPIPPIVHHN